MKRLTKEEFIKKSVEIHGDIYNYSEVIYINSKIKVKIYCKIHNIWFSQMPSSHLKGFSGCKKCSIEKIKQTCLKRLGYENASQSPEIQKKKEQTMLEHHGVKHALQSPEIKKKMEQTMINRHDVKHAFQSPEIKEKMKQTMSDRFGYEYALQSPEIRKKMEQTNLDRFGYKNPACSPEIQEKMRRTNLSRLGHEYASQSPEIQNKMKQTNLGRLGYEYCFQSPEIQKKIEQTNLERFGTKYPLQSHISQESLKLLNNPEWLKHQHHVEKLTLTQIGLNLQVTGSTVGNYFKKYNIQVFYFFQSTGELELCEFIQSLGHKIETSLRNIIPPYELDIFIPEINIAVEYNGIYWHKDKGVNYHKNKTDLCNIMGIHLIHIWEDQWIDNQEETKSIIIKILNNKPLLSLKSEIEVNLSLENINMYIDLGYKIVNYSEPKKYLNNIWDCGSCKLKIIT